MRKLLYAMHFRSQTSAVAGRSGVLHSAGSAASCVVSTTISSSGVQTELRGTDGGDLAFFESELRMTGPEAFEESGNITFGDEGICCGSQPWVKAMWRQALTPQSWLARPVGGSTAARASSPPPAASSVQLLQSMAPATDAIFIAVLFSSMSRRRTLRRLS